MEMFGENEQCAYLTKIRTREEEKIYLRMEKEFSNYKVN